MDSKEVLVNQPTAAPTPKVAAAGVAGVVITLILTVLSIFGIVIPDDVTGQVLILISSLQTIITFLVAYFKRNKAQPVIVNSFKG